MPVACVDTNTTPWTLPLDVMAPDDIVPTLVKFRLLKSMAVAAPASTVALEPNVRVSMSCSVVPDSIIDPK